MRRGIRIAAAVILMGVVFTACGKEDKAAQTEPANEPSVAAQSEEEQTDGQTSGQSETTPDSLSFTDDLGRRVTVKNPQRVAPLIGSFADIWTLAGGSDVMVATAHDAWTEFSLDLDGVTDLGSTKELNLETLIASNPDFIIASSNTAVDVDLMPVFEDMGVPTAYFQVSTFEEYLHMLEICTQITGDTQAYETNGLAIRKQIEEARATADQALEKKEAPTALYIRASSSGCKVKNSENSVLGEMLKDLGCVNVADSSANLLENLSIEAIVESDPDYIFLVYQSSDPTVAAGVLDEMLRSNPVWETLRAVKEDRCYVMDPHLYNLKPNDRWGEAYENLANILYSGS